MESSSSSTALTQTNPFSPKKKRRRAPVACEECRTRKVKCELGEGDKCARCVQHQRECSGKLGSKTEHKIYELKQRMVQMESTLYRLDSEREDKTDVYEVTSGLGVQRIVSKQPMHEEIETLSSGFLEDFPPGQSSCLGLLDLTLARIKSKAPAQDVDITLSGSDCQLTVPLHKLAIATPPRRYFFPDPDLLRELISLYFENINICFWLLHRPSFETSVSDNLHLKDPMFAEVVLLVAATASRYSRDPRVLADNSGGNWLSSGWKWFSQVQAFPNTLLGSLGLYELQKICLYNCYLYGSSHPYLVWSLGGIGLRLAQGMGIHHWRKPGNVQPLEAELWKRAFWILLCVDRIACSVLGRPCYTHEEEFDIELPTSSDEEYWEIQDVNQRFKQPEGKPSKQIFLIAMIRLTDILAFTLRTVYSVGKFKTFLSRSSPRWREDILQRIDSALNKWQDMVPDYLRWPVSQVGTPFYNQSASLYLMYHSIQIQSHRPFIPSLIGRSELSLSSLVICANAARSCSHIFEILVRHPPIVIQPFCAPVALTASVFLLLYIWEGEKFGLTVDPAKELKNVRHCLNFMRCMEPRFATAGHAANLLERLLLQEEKQSMGVPLQEYSGTGPRANLGPQVYLNNVGSTAPVGPQLPTDPGDFFNSFLGDGAAAAADGVNWGLNDITMLHSLGTVDEFYQKILASFNDTSFPNAGLDPVPQLDP